MSSGRATWATTSRARSTDGRDVEVRFEAPDDPRGLWIGGRMPVMGLPQLGKLRATWAWSCVIAASRR